jgi:hypothetical protein
VLKSSSSPKLIPSNFEPELISTMRLVLDVAVEQIAVANRTPATKAKKRNGFCGPRLTA